MAVQTLPRQTSTGIQAVAGFAAFIALALQSASLSEGSGDSILGVGRVLVGAMFCSLLVHHLFQGLGKTENDVVAGGVRALVVAELAFTVVVFTNLLWVDSAVLATAWIYLLGLALLASHLSLLIVNGQKQEASGR